jgi:hypothetical protein
MLLATQYGMLPFSRLRDKSICVSVVTLATSQLSVPASPRPASDSAVGTLLVTQATPLQEALHSGPTQLASCVPVGPRSAARNASRAAAALAADAGGGLGGGGLGGSGGGLGGGGLGGGRGGGDGGLGGGGLGGSGLGGLGGLGDGGGGGGGGGGDWPVAERSSSSANSMSSRRCGPTAARSLPPAIARRSRHAARRVAMSPAKRASALARGAVGIRGACLLASRACSGPEAPSAHPTAGYSAPKPHARALAPAPRGRESSSHRRFSQPPLTESLGARAADATPRRAPLSGQRARARCSLRASWAQPRRAPSQSA